MRPIVELAREIAGLFVDDGALALWVLALVAACAVLAEIGMPLLVGAVLLLGCLALLAESVRRASRR